MSIECLNKAIQRKFKPSGAKFVLVILANFANEDCESYPTIETLSNATGQDRKTVMVNLKLLVDSGLITDTGKRVGRTGLVPVYRLSMGDIQNIGSYRVSDPNYQPSKALHLNSIIDDLNDTKNGTVTDESGNDTKNGTVTNDTKNGTVKNITVPETDSNSAENGTLKQSQKRYSEPSSLNHQEPPPIDEGKGDVSLTEEPLPINSPVAFNQEWLNREDFKALLREVLIEYGIQVPLMKHRKFLSVTFNPTAKKQDWLREWEMHLRTKIDIKATYWVAEEQGTTNPNKLNTPPVQFIDHKAQEEDPATREDENYRKYTELLKTSKPDAEYFLKTLESIGLHLNHEDRCFDRVGELEEA